jgi:putative Mg2+ transporter-C (MgtC) family protein
MIEFVSDPEFVIFGKLLLATLLGIAIGTERAVVAQQAAGSRTFGLVSLGSCLFIVAGMAANQEFIGLVNFDPTRVLSAVIQGIGFLGAGLIIFKNETLHGVTTAAGLWVAAGVGCLVAFDMYAVAIFVTFLVLFVFFAMWYVEKSFKKNFSGLLVEMQDDAPRR